MNDNKDNDKIVLRGFSAILAALCALAINYLLAPALVCYGWNYAARGMWPTLPYMTFKYAFWFIISLSIVFSFKGRRPKK